MIQRFFRLKQTEQFLFIQACFFCGLISLLVALFPLRRFIDRLGKRGVESSFTAIDGKEEVVLQIKKAIRRARRYLPWKTKCFATAIAAKILLNKRRIPSTIYLGVAKDDDRMIAHAWLRCGNEIITGKEEMQKFIPVLFFT